MHKGREEKAAFTQLSCGGKTRNVEPEGSHTKESVRMSFPCCQPQFPHL